MGNSGRRGTTKILLGGLAAALLLPVAVAGAIGGVGKTAAERATSSQVLSDLNPKPVQEITGVDCSTHCDLYARAGTVTVAGHTVPIWGYTTDAAPTAAPMLPGPTIVATADPTNANAAIHITLHNELAVASSLSFPRFSVAAVTGFGEVATSGHDATYDLKVNSGVGTSVYEAGPTPTGNRQVAMGLAGVLIVRPATTSCPTAKHCTYGDPASGGVGLPTSVFGAADIADDEALVALNDLDPAFAARPLTYDMATYAPQLHLINGKAFPDTEVIDTTAGSTVGLHIANLSSLQHTMGIVGGHQTVLGRDAAVLAHTDEVVAPLLTSGETMDAAVHVSTGAPAGQRFALYDQGRNLRNAHDGGYGGALTFINVWGTEGVPGQPVAQLDALAIPATSPPGDVTDGRAFDFAGTAPPVAGPAEGRWYIDGLPTWRVATDGATTDGSSTVTSATAAFTAADQGKPISGAGIPPSSFVGTVTSPTVVELVDASAAPVTATVTASNVALTIGTAPTSITVPDGGGLFVGHVTADDLGGQDNGSHVVWVELSTDGTHWGAPRGVAFSLDRGGPSMIGTSIDPAVSNGTADLTLRTTGDTTVTGTANVVEGRYALDQTCADVPTSPTAMGPDPAPDLRNEPVQGFVATIPHAQVGAEGTHHALVAARDELGHWPNSSLQGGAALCDDVTYTIDTHGPAVSGGDISPNPTNGNQAYSGNTNFLDSIRVLATVTDPVSAGVSSNIVKAEAFLDGNYIDGSGTPIALPSGAVDGKGIEFHPIDGAWDSPSEVVYAYVPLATVRALAPGQHGVWIHGLDQAGNWGPTTTAPSAVLDYEPDAPTVNFLNVDGTTLSTGATAARPTMTVTAIEYSIGIAPLAPGAGIAFPTDAVTTAGPVATVRSATIGVRTATDNVWVRAQDNLGHWSAAVGLPAVSTAFVTFGPGGGSSRLTATAASSIGDLRSVQYGTMPLGSGTTPPASWQTINGSGGPSPVTVNLPDTPSNRVVWVRALDAQDNVGPAIALPTLSALNRTANGTTITGTAASVTSTVAVLQYRGVGSNGNVPPGSGWQNVTIPFGQASVSFFQLGIPSGGRVWVRSQDAAGNWGPAVRL